MQHQIKTENSKVNFVLCSLGRSSSAGCLISFMAHTNSATRSSQFCCLCVSVSAPSFLVCSHQHDTECHYSYLGKQGLPTCPHDSSMCHFSPSFIPWPSSCISLVLSLNLQDFAISSSVLPACKDPLLSNYIVPSFIYLLLVPPECCIPPPSIVGSGSPTNVA